ncbi:MAG: hypothetical protein ACLS59_08355 [Clostridia bacterium]|jgi:DNA-directed RNA polymerase subunit RPC12/RpoP
MIKYICDKCGKEVKRIELRQIEVLDADGNIKKAGIHWCEDCVSKINEMNRVSFPILDTSGIAFEVELDKLKEETEELLGAAIKYKTNEIVTIDNVIEESYDVIQVVVNIIDRLGLMDYMQEGLEKHIEKLKGRGWEFKEVSKK